MILSRELDVAAIGKVVVRIMSGFGWLGGRRGVLVFYLRYDYVGTGFNVLRICCEVAYVSSRHCRLGSSFIHGGNYIMHKHLGMTSI